MHFEFQGYGGAWHKATIEFVQKWYILISWFWTFLEVRSIRNSAYVNACFFSTDNQSPRQMFPLFSGRHIGRHMKTANSSLHFVPRLDPGDGPKTAIKRAIIINAFFILPVRSILVSFCFCKFMDKLKVPLKRNFCMWDFCLVIKFQPYLETLQTFFSHTVSKNCFFSRSKLAG